MAAADRRSLNWATVVYPESAPDGWLQSLDDFHVPCFVSPLHDKDINADNTPKKPHYHVLFMFECVKSRSQVAELVSVIGGVGCECVGSKKGYARYLTHMDNPEKFQYDAKDVRSFGGACYEDVVVLTSRQRYQAIAEMMEFIQINNIDNFAVFVEVARCEHFEDWFPFLCDNSAFIIEKYINGCYQRNRRLAHKC